MSDLKSDLLTYLQRGRDAVVWKLAGASEYDVRRPLTPTGTSLLGLVKHLTAMDAGYLGEVFGRPFPEPLPWADDDDPESDMWATADESREELLALYRRVWAHGDATVAALDLTETATVPWWPEERRHPTLQRVLVHLVAETQRHAGHADVLRELADGAVGDRAEFGSSVGDDAARWTAHHARVQAAADAFRP
jgi:uncharacterized damage-inducible protein DinB